MAQKIITDLTLIDEVTDDVNFPSDDGIQSYRATALQVKNYVLPDSSITLAKLAAEVLAKLVPPGVTHAYSAATAPTGYLVCDGALISRTTYADLFAILGVKHGSGDGSTTFNLPDYRGLFLRGWANGTGRDPDVGSRVAANPGGAVGDNIGSNQDDAFQGHYHDLHTAAGVANVRWRNNLSTGSAGGGVAIDDTVSPLLLATTVANGNYGTIRPSTETRGKNSYVNYIIKY